MIIPWETLTEKEIETELKTNFTKGLSQSDISGRIEKYGKNILEEEKTLGILGKVLKQFRSPLVFILLAAGITTFFLKEYLDTTVIFIALTINVIIGTFQEERASRAFEKLNESQEQFATVIRDRRKIVVSSGNLVPGDIVVLLGGSHVPADLRLLEAKNLSINEAVLTGEWLAVSKETGEISKNIPLAERFNMAWKGTLVSAGYGLGVAVGTGEDTEVGKIARQLGSTEERVTPLQQNIRKVARFLVLIIIAALVVIFALGLYRGEPIGELLLIAIAIAVATIPEGLPAAVTVVLALGMESILKRGGLVKSLLAAETLGSTTIILTDKTGTLTEAKMKLAHLYTSESIEANKDERTADDRELLKMAVIASDAFVEEIDNDPDKLTVHGRPIERAIIFAGLEVGITQDELKNDRKRVDFLQFESKRRFGASLNKHQDYKNNRLYLTGSPEFLLEHATHLYKNGKKVPFTKMEQTLFENIQKEKSAEGVRFIGISYKETAWDTVPDVSKKEGLKNILEESIFVGFLSFFDPIREDVKESIKLVKQAGAEVIMLTGDNPGTAFKIAKDVGIATEKDTPLLGSDTEKLDDTALFKALKTTKVFARVLPDQKLRIARILKNNNEVVAMTGDGVNDAPALRSANIGIAVGSGTEVAKEASDMVLLDNSFSIIVSAIEEGRKIIDNLKKIISYLLSTSFSEIFLIGGALIVGVPLPLLPVQILWANIVEEGFMSFPFAFEKKDPNIMKRDPRSHRVKTILTKEIKSLIFIVGTITGIFLFVLYLILLKLDLPIEEIRTFMFVALSIDSIFFAFSLKSLSRPIWKINIFTNIFLLVALFFSIALLMLAVFWGPLQTLLSLVPLSYLELLLLFGIGLFNLLTIEITKYFIFERRLAK